MLQEVSCLVAERWRQFESQQCSIVTWSLVSSANEVKVKKRGEGGGELYGNFPLLILFLQTSRTSVAMLYNCSVPYMVMLHHTVFAWLFAEPFDPPLPSPGGWLMS